jgi:cytosine permease
LCFCTNERLFFVFKNIHKIHTIFYDTHKQLNKKRSEIMEEQSNTKVTTTNDFATTRVPAEFRKGTFEVSMVAAGFCIAMSGLFTGASMAAGLTFPQAIMAALIGNTILGFFGGLIGAAGAREGLSSSRLSRFSFGTQGFKVVSLVLALTMFGWFSVQVGFFGNTINAMFPNAGFITNVPVAAFWGGILMLLTAYFGFKGLSALSMIAVPLIVITATIGVFLSVSGAGGWDQLFAMEVVGTITLTQGITMVVGSFAAGASAQADITRYAKDEKAAWISTFIGYMIANSFIILAGFLTSLATGEGDLPRAMLAIGLGLPSLLVLIAAQWTTNDNNLYTSSLGLSNIFKTKKSNIVLVLGVLGSALGAFGMADYFVGWLVILGVGVPPMAGIILADYFIIHSGKYDLENDSDLPAWNMTAIIAWLVAGVAGYTVNWGIASLNSLVVAMVIYIVLMKTVSKRVLVEG